MKLICVHCGNYAYFEVDIETVKEISTNAEGIIIENAFFADLDYTEETLRDNLNDIVEYVLKQNGSEMLYDPESETYYNRHIRCARCGSKKVTPPIRKTHCQLPLEEEIQKYREEFNLLRKERCDNENHLPELWQP